MMGKPEPFRWSPAEAPPQIQAHSKAKLALVRSYLAKYIRRLGGERRRDIFKLDFVDGFAGGGTFTDGTTEISGSPIIMLEEAAKAETELNLDRAKPLIFDFAYYFVDKNQDHTNHLKNVLRKRQHDDSERVFVLTEEFSAACPKVIAAIKKRQPRAGRSIFLLDQFGWKDVPLGVMATIFVFVYRVEARKSAKWCAGLVRMCRYVQYGSRGRQTGRFEGARARG